MMRYGTEARNLVRKAPLSQPHIFQAAPEHISERENRNNCCGMDFGFQGASCWRGPLRNPEHVLFPESVCRNVSVCHFGLGLLFAFYFFSTLGLEGIFCGEARSGEENFCVFASIVGRACRAQLLQTFSRSCSLVSLFFSPQSLRNQST